MGGQDLRVQPRRHAVIGTQLEVTVLRMAVLVLLATSVLGWGCAVTRGAKAETAGARGTVCEARTVTLTQTVVDTEAQKARLAAIQAECAGERKRLLDANRTAVADAYEAGRSAVQRQEDYMTRLATPDAECEAFVRSQVCPALMDY